VSVLVGDSANIRHQRSLHAYKKNLSMEEPRALYSVIRSEMEAIGYLKLFD
jgi:hypothetical protein